MGKKLDPKRARFVDEYLVDLNATQAAIRAGYSPKTATVQGSRLLTYANVAEAIAIAKLERANRVQVEADEVLAELLTIIRSDVRDYVPGPDGELLLREGAPDSAWRAVAAVKHSFRTIYGGRKPKPKAKPKARGKLALDLEALLDDEDEDDGPRVVEHDVEIKLWNKNQAIEAAMKHLGLLKDGAPGGLTLNNFGVMLAPVEVTIIDPPPMRTIPPRAAAK